VIKNYNVKTPAMALILSIDTAMAKAGIAVSKDGVVLSILENTEQKEHAAWLNQAVQEIMQITGYEMRDLKALAVSAGPGSYTGLRVGMAAAKGFCYALNIPLIAEDTLKVMAFAAKEQTPGEHLLCPMIDARRMEVFTALYRHDMTPLLPSTAMVIDENSFSTWLADNKVSFFGEGADKCKPLITAPSAHFTKVNYHAGYLADIAFLRYLQGEFTGLAYSEPAYTKEFYTHTRK
jgi:tRNA threonylcarbamoyladenosine biosynthesis protein TsaB